MKNELEYNHCVCRPVCCCPYSGVECKEAQNLIEAKNSLNGRSKIPCGDCFKLLPINMECDNPECVRVIIKNIR